MRVASLGFYAAAIAATLGPGPAYARVWAVPDDAASSDVRLVGHESGPSDDLATTSLLERLQAAESRIATLEAERTTGGAVVMPGLEPAGTAFVFEEDAVPDDQTDGEANEAGDNETGDNEAGDNEAGDNEAVEEVNRRLETLQKEWETHQESLEQAADDAAKKPTFDAGGRIHLDTWSFLESSDGIGYFEHSDAGDPQFGTDPENRFVFRRIRLELEGDVPDLMFWRMQVDFNEPNEPQMKDVYLGWELPANHRLIVGHQKLPLSADALYSSRFTTFMERPLVADAFVTDYRRLGAMFYGFSDDQVFNWRYGMFELQNIQDEGAYVGDSLQMGVAGRLASTPWYDETSNGRGYLHLGIAGLVVRPDGDVSARDSNSNVARFAARPEARSDRQWVDTRPIDGAQWYEQAGLEAALNLGAMHVSGEFMTTWVQRDATTEGTGPDTFFHGGYVQASYFLTGEHVPWDREEGVIDRIKPHENFFLVDRCTGGTGSGWGAWQVATRYDYVDLTDADIRGGVENNLTFAVNWWWNPYARLQFNATRGLIEQHHEVGGYDSGDFWLAGTRFAIDF